MFYEHTGTIKSANGCDLECSVTFQDGCVEDVFVEERDEEGNLVICSLGDLHARYPDSSESIDALVEEGQREAAEYAASGEGHAP